MNLINVKVIHKKYGDGVIISNENNYLTVKFTAEEKQFLYPEAISNGFLTVQDENLYNSAVNDAKIKAEKQKRVEDEKKAEKERNEKERLATATHENGVKKTIKRENVAFKLTYCDGGKSNDKIGFCGPCSKKNIEYNVKVKGHVWCSVGSKCSKFLNGDIPYSLVCEEYEKHGLCYESAMLEQWIAGAGLVQTGVNKGKPLTLKKVQPNSLAILTTRLPGFSEERRIIFAVFLVDESYEGDGRECGYVTTNSKWKLELKPDEAKQILFWNYYTCPNAPDKIRFGSGLFRYVSDVQAAQILRDIVKVKKDEREREFANEFFNTFCQKNNISIEEIGENSGALILKQIKNFEEFMQNPYWREMYENAPENVKKYYKLDWSEDQLKAWTDEELIEDGKQFEAIENTFSKEDWEYIIKHSHGRFKYYTTKKMNKRFPPVEKL